MNLSSDSYYMNHHYEKEVEIMEKKLYRVPQGKMISGVCGGFAEYLAIDPTIVRIGTVILAFVTAFFPVFIAYIICAAIMPEKPVGYTARADEDQVEVLDKEGNRVQESGLKKNNRLIGILLVGFGGFLLFDRLFWWFDHRMFWSLAIVAVGLVILLKGKKDNTDDFK